MTNKMRDPLTGMTQEELEYYDRLEKSVDLRNKEVHALIEAAKRGVAVPEYMLHLAHRYETAIADGDFKSATQIYNWI